MTSPTVAPNRPRVVGEARSTNPLIAAAAGVSWEHVVDLDEEIEATEKYLAALRVIRAVASREELAFPAGPPATPLAIAAAPERPPVPAAKPTTAPREHSDKPTVASVIRAALLADPDTPVVAIINAVKASGASGNSDAIRTSYYNVKTGLRRDGKIPSAAPKTPSKTTTPTPAPRPTPAPPTDTGDEDEDEDEDVDEESPEYTVGGKTKLEQDRARVAEFVFKKGLADVPTILRNVDISAADVGLVLNHVWFERHTDKWRLTAKGKQEGVTM